MQPTIELAKSSNTLNKLTFVLLYATDFADRLEKEVIPALKAGFIVLSDRYIFTALARAGVRGVDRQWLRNLYGFAIAPHMVFYLNIDVKTLIGRVLESRGMDYWESGMDLKHGDDIYDSFRTYQGRLLKEYASMGDEFHFRTLDARRSIDRIQEELRKQVGAFLEPVEKPSRVAPRPLAPLLQAGRAKASAQRRRLLARAGSVQGDQRNRCAADCGHREDNRRPEEILPAGGSLRRDARDLERDRHRQRQRRLMPGERADLDGYRRHQQKRQRDEQPEPPVVIAVGPIESHRRKVHARHRRVDGRLRRAARQGVRTPTVCPAAKSRNTIESARSQSHGFPAAAPSRPRLLHLGLEEIQQAGPAAGSADRRTHRISTRTHPFEVAMLQFDPGGTVGLRREGDFDFARFGEVGLVAPLMRDLPRDDEAVRRIPFQDLAPVAVRCRPPGTV